MPVDEYEHPDPAERDKLDSYDRENLKRKKHKTNTEQALDTNLLEESDISTKEQWSDESESLDNL